MKTFYLITCFAILSSCGKLRIDVGARTKVIYGSVPELTGLVSRNRSSSFSAYAAICEAKVSLYRLGANDQLLSPAITEAEIENDGSFSFSHFDATTLEETGNYLLDVSASDGCAGFLQRPLTDPSGPQIISTFSSLIAYSRLAPLDRKLNEVPREKLEELLKDTETINDFEAAFEHLQDRREAEFSSAFNDGPDKLLMATPWLKSVTFPNVIRERASHVFRSQSFHWKPDYSFAVLWKLDGTAVSNSSQWTYTPSGNESGEKTLELYIGSDDGGGNIDTSLPYIYRAWELDVQNTVLPRPPLLDSGLVITNDTNFPLSIITGPGRAECDSFDSMALVLGDAVPTVFNLNCTTPLSQTESILLTGPDGEKTVKLWARDSTGEVSLLPSTINVILDREGPALSLTAPTTPMAGGVPFTLSFSATDPRGITEMELQFSSDNGATWSSIENLSGGSTTHPWEIPLVNSTEARVKLIATDLAGNSEETISNPFTIISSAPNPPDVTLASATPTSSLSGSIAITNCGIYDKVFIKETATPRPASGHHGWVDCTDPLVFNLSDHTNGTRSLYVFGKDIAGNVSNGSLVQTTYDNQAPSPSFFHRDTPAFTNTASISASYTNCAGVSHVLLKANNTPPTLEDSGWVGCATTASLLTHIINSSEGVQSVYGFAKDSAGNISSPATLSTTLDLTPPFLTGTLLNPSADDPSLGDEYSGTANVIVRVKANDALSLALKIRAIEAPDSNGDCESQFSEGLWHNYSPTNLGDPVNYFITIAPLDETKKVCVWAKDEAGNRSLIAGTTPELLGINMDTIKYEVGNIPVITEFSAENGNDGSTDFTSGEPVTIGYSISDVEGLENSPVSVSYSLNNLTWFDIHNGLDTTIPTNVVWIGGPSGNPLTSSGTTSFPAPSSGYFKLRIVARDRSGNTSIAAYSDAMNGTPWSIYAGNIDNGDGGTAMAARLEAGSGSTSHFAVSPLTNDLFVADEKGTVIRKLDSRTGLVSTFIKNGPTNLSDGGTIPPQINLPGPTNPRFDSKGRLYIHSNAGFWQIDFSSSLVRRYMGSTRTESNAQATHANVAWTSSSYAFDEDDSLYFFAKCKLSENGNQKAVRIMKLTQLPNGAQGNLSIVAGNCLEGNPPGGGPLSALDIPLGSKFESSGTATPSDGISNITVWGRGKYIFYSYYSGNGLTNKILDGQWYRSNIALETGSTFLYNPNDQKLYQSSGSIRAYTPNLSGANGDTVGVTTFVSSTGSGNCSDDNIPSLSACIRSGMAMDLTSSGIILFPDGASTNSSGTFRIRYIDPSTSKTKTLMGSKPFFGDGLTKGLVRGNISGIHYKATDSQGFPAGLYFMDQSALVMGRINTNTQETEVLFGDQSLRSQTATNGQVVDKNESLGTPYNGGNGMPLAFDQNGLPWFRITNRLYSLTEDHKLIPRMAGGSYWSDAVDGANPASYRLYVMGLRGNLTLSEDGVFIFGTAMSSSDANASNNTKSSIRHFNFTVPSTTRIMGDSSTSSAPDETVTPGLVKNLSLNCPYSNSSVCYSSYDKTTDTLYFSEPTVSKLRYITNASDTSLAKLHSIQLTRSPANFSFRPDRSELYYLSGGKLYCKKLGTTGNCTETDLGPSSLIGSIANGPDQLTWLDNDTLLISTYNGLILKFQLAL